MGWPVPKEPLPANLWLFNIQTFAPAAGCASWLAHSVYLSKRLRGRRFAPAGSLISGAAFCTTGLGLFGMYQYASVHDQVEAAAAKAGMPPPLRRIHLYEHTPHVTLDDFALLGATAFLLASRLLIKGRCLTPTVSGLKRTIGYTLLGLGVGSYIGISCYSRSFRAAYNDWNDKVQNEKSQRAADRQAIEVAEQPGPFSAPEKAIETLLASNDFTRSAFEVLKRKSEEKPKKPRYHPPDGLTMLSYPKTSQEGKALCDRLHKDIEQLQFGLALGSRDVEGLGIVIAEREHQYWSSDEGPEKEAQQKAIELLRSFHKGIEDFVFEISRAIASRQKAIQQLEAARRGQAWRPVGSKEFKKERNSLDLLWDLHQLAQRNEKDLQTLCLAMTQQGHSASLAIHIEHVRKNVEVTVDVLKDMSTRMGVDLDDALNHFEGHDPFRK